MLSPALAQALAASTRIRVTVVDPMGGADIAGEVTGAISETHVRVRADDGLVFPAAKDRLRFTSVALQEGGNGS